METRVEYTELFIGGAWVTPSGSGVIEVMSPHTERVIGSVPAASTADVDRAVEIARAAFDSGEWAQTPLADRIAVVTRIKDAIFAWSE